MKQKIILIVLVFLMLICSNSHARFSQTEFFVATHYGVARLGPSLEYEEAGDVTPGDIWAVVDRQGDWIQIVPDPPIFVYEKFGRIETLEDILRRFKAGLLK